ENAIFENIETTRQSSITQNSIAAGLQYRRNWTEHFNMNLNIYETDYMLKAINANILDDQRFIQENRVSESGARLEASQSFKEGWQLLGGYQFVETKVTNLDDVDNPVFYKLDGEVVRTHGIYSQLDFVSENRQTHLNAGVRYNLIGKFNKHIWEPRLSFNQRFLENFNLEVLGEFKHQSTSQVINFQNDFLGIEKRRWQLSDNAEIPIIRSKQVSGGLSYSEKGWLINAVGYFKNVDGITTQSQGFQNQYEFVKARGSYDAVGMDVLVRKQFNKVNTWLSYSYLDSDYTFNTLAENTFPSNLDITHAITFGSSYKAQHFRFSAGLNWRSGKPTTIPVVGNEVVNDEVNYDVTNKERLDDYLRVDLSSIYQFNFGKKTRANIGLSVWNLLDRENTINIFYRVNALGNAEEVRQNSLGITPNAVFRLYF
ncbi:MAG: TonB-dependent receptor, partial [Eudoraea sp.]|nr:TonB-dependent receptor [Eudoraea sp.]